jgi:hypothetical protein
MSTPLVIRSVVSFLFSDAGAPYRATPTANVGGSSPVNQTAQGLIDVVLSDFGITLRLVANRLQQTYTLGTAADFFLIDPPHFAIASWGFKTEVLGKQGHSDNRLISNQWMTKCFREDAHGMIGDVEIGAAVLDTPT